MRRQTPKAKQVVLNTLSEGFSRQDAAHAAGVSLSQFYHWLKRDLAFKTAVTVTERQAQGSAGDDAPWGDGSE